MCACRHTEEVIMIKIMMHGCCGHMGQVISELVEKDPEAEITVGVDIADKGNTSYPVYTDLSAWFSPSFFTYSRLWIRPQIRTCPPTAKAEAYRAFLPQQIQGM